ncbi:hypothetical protein U9M48_009661 [Paspalum notatum var. saurae]|uniref:Uncharacterized protein n=1 Tax=Paspalum notatum var. saurae TaxID=547442 RepID=A0AAQ3SRY6_PASNO
MDAPAMVTRKHVPEDVGLRNAGEVEDEGGQGQLHRGDEKQHKPVLKKVKEKVKKIKNTLAGGHGHGHDGEHGGGDERLGDAGSNSSEEGEEDAAEREDAVEKGGYMEDVEDKPVVTESEPEYEPARAPAVAEVEGDGAAPRVRFGDLGGPVVEDPAAPHSTTRAAREGEDIGTTPVVQQFENMNLSDDPAHVGAGKEAAKAEEWKDKAAADATGGASYTDRIKNAAAGTTEYGKKLASTVYEKVAGVGGTAAGAGKRGDGERTEAAPASNAAGVEEWKDAPEATADAARGESGAGYTDKIKSAAAGTTGYGKQLASTVYDKVAGVAPSLRPQVGAGKPDDAHARGVAMPVSDAGAEQEWKDAAADTDTTNTGASSGPGYTDKIKSAAAGTTEYGKQLASTVYEKVAGVGTAVAGKVQSAGTATPGVGAQQQDASAGGGQDKGVTVTGYIAEKLRPGDEDRALSESISGAVQRRKEGVGGSTVAQRVPAPGQVMTKAREAVASLTGGNRVSETVQPTATTGEEAKEADMADAPVIRDALETSAGESPLVLEVVSELVLELFSGYGRIWRVGIPSTNHDLPQDVLENPSNVESP